MEKENEKEKYYIIVEDDEDIYVSTESQNVNITTSLLSTLSPAGAKRPLADDDSFDISSSIDSDDISSSREERYCAH